MLKKDNLFGILATLSKEYSVSFDVKPTAYARSVSQVYHSVLHVTQGEDYGIYGERTPGVWILQYPSKTKNPITICSPISGDHNSCFNTQAFPTNEWIRVKIEQNKVGGDYFYTIRINGKEVYKVKNNHVQVFYDLKVYAGDPWYQVQEGVIRNLIIVNSVE